MFCKRRGTKTRWADLMWQPDQCAVVFPTKRHLFLSCWLIYAKTSAHMYNANFTSDSLLCHNKTSFFSGNTDWSYSDRLRWELLGICENSDLKFQQSSCLAKSEKKWPQSFRICWRFIKSASGWRQVKKYEKLTKNRTRWSKKHKKKTVNKTRLMRAGQTVTMNWT